MRMTLKVPIVSNGQSTLAMTGRPLRYNGLQARRDYLDGVSLYRGKYDVLEKCSEHKARMLSVYDSWIVGLSLPVASVFL